MDPQSLADWLVWIGKLQGLGFLGLGCVCCYKIWKHGREQISELRWQLRYSEEKVRKWRDLYVATLDFKDPRGLFKEAKVSYGCLDTGDHPFCSHDCCGDKPACRTDEIRGERGSLKDYPSLDPTPPEGWLARLFWAKPSDVAAAKWRWEKRMGLITAAKAEMAAAREEKRAPRVHNLTIGPLLDLPHVNDGLAGWEPRQRIKDPTTNPRRTEGTEVRWQGTTRPASPPDHEDGGQRRPNPGPVRR